MRQIALIIGCCLAAAAQNTAPAGTPQLSAKDLLDLESHVTQLMEAAALAVPGLAAAGAPIRQSAEATIAAQRTAPGSNSLNYRFVNQTKAWLAVADAFPRPVPFPPTAAQQFNELRLDFDRLQQSFEASLGMQEEQSRAYNADPNQLSRYAADNAKLPPSAPDSARVVFYGDSITDLWRLNEYFTGKDFINRGISGQTTAQMLARFQQDVIGLQPKVVVILAGTNDIAHGIAIQAIEDDLRMMGELAKANGIRVVFASVTPVTGRPAAPIVELNDWIRQNCQKESFPYVNYYASMADSKGQMIADLSDDGLHPNAKGYRVMSPLVVDAINLALYDAPAAPQQKKRFGIVPPL